MKPPSRDADHSVVDWIRSTAITLTTVEPRSGYKDLEGLRAIIGDARIVSLGEATHGTREFFKLKHRVLEFCVAELGFTTFIIEANFPESLAVNAFVLDGVGNAADALTGMRFWVWDTEEVLDLIEWMRRWNANNARKIKFYGFTMSYPAIAAQRLIDYLACVAPDLAEHCKSELAPMTSDFTAQLFSQLPDASRKCIFDCIARVLAAFAKRRSEWTTTTSATEWHLGRLLATVLYQGAQFQIERNSTIHERATAENVCALLDAEGPDAKAVVWSHNTHAARAAFAGDGQSMGKCLDDIVGRTQVVIGCSFDRGSFQARTFPTLELADHRVAAATPNSFDALLAQAGLPLFSLDLANAPRDGAAGTWLASETSMRSIGGIYGIPENNGLGVTYSNSIVPRDHFDAVLFVAETTAARRNQTYFRTPDLVALPAPTNLALSGEGIPTDWQHFGASRKHDCAIVVSEEVSPRGGRTVRFSRDAPWRWGDGQLIQKISAQAWQGRRLRFFASVRTEVQHVGAGALLFLKFLPKPAGDDSDFFRGSLATFASNPQPIQSPQWVNIAVEAKVPETAATIVIGLVMTGNGDVWFGDLKVE